MPPTGRVAVHSRFPPCCRRAVPGAAGSVSGITAWTGKCEQEVQPQTRLVALGAGTAPGDGLTARGSGAVRSTFPPRSWVIIKTPSRVDLIAQRIETLLDLRQATVGKSALSGPAVITLKISAYQLELFIELGI